MSEESAKEDVTENITQLNEYFKHIDELVKGWGANFYVVIGGEPLGNLTQHDWLQGGVCSPYPHSHFLHHFAGKVANTQELALSAGESPFKTEAAEGEAVAAEAIFESFIAEIEIVRSRMLQVQEDIETDKVQTRAVIAKLQA